MKYTVTLLVENEGHVDGSISRNEAERMIIEELNDGSIIPTKIGGISITAIDCRLIER